LVSRKKPGAAPRRPAPAFDLGEVDGLLARLIEQGRAGLFEPWRAMLEASPDMQPQIDEIVAQLQVFFNKWTVEVLVVLGQRETVRFNELKASLRGISGRTLSQRLRELEAQGLVKRVVHDEMPVRVEYSLTRKGTDVATLALPLVLYLLTSPG
jgi:DNA-binding HxlR family transcriptional regulator